MKGPCYFPAGASISSLTAFRCPLARWLIRLADIYYVRKPCDGPTQNDRREDYTLASRIRRRTTTARYFYLLIIGLVDDKPLPKLPMLGDAIAELRIATVSRRYCEANETSADQPRALAGLKPGSLIVTVTAELPAFLDAIQNVLSVVI